MAGRAAAPVAGAASAPIPAHPVMVTPFAVARACAEASLLTHGGGGGGGGAGPVALVPADPSQMEPKGCVAQAPVAWLATALQTELTVAT
jgi:hypothetical protein